MSLPTRTNTPRMGTVYGGQNARNHQDSSQSSQQRSYGALGQNSLNDNNNNSIGSFCLTCIRAIPIVTITSTVIMIALFIFSAIKSSKNPNFVVQNFANCPREIFGNNFEFWRLFTAGFFHLNVLHIILNGLVSLFIASPIERSIGSLPMIGLILSFAIFPQLLYAGIFYLMYAITSDASWIATCAAGYSAHIFGYIILLIVLLDMRTINFCCIDIPAFIYPWVLLAITSLLNTRASFVGHLTGMLVAYLYVYGFINWFTLPRKWLLKLENGPLRCLQSRIWIPTPELQPNTLYFKNLRFTRRSYDNLCGPIIDRAEGSTDGSSGSGLGGVGGAVGARDREYAAASARYAPTMDAGSSTRTPSVARSTPASRMPTTGGRVLGSVPVSSTTTNTNTNANVTARNLRVLPLASNAATTTATIPTTTTTTTTSAIPPTTGSINTPNPTAPSQTELEDENATGYTVRSPRRKKDGYTQLVDDDTAGDHRV